MGSAAIIIGSAAVIVDGGGKGPPAGFWISQRVDSMT